MGSAGPPSATTPVSGSGSSSAAAPRLDISQEVRLAVVMYGGISLAIYMNGIAEELFHFVRATAPERGAGSTGGQGVAGVEHALLAERGPDARSDPGALQSTERVYRKLAQILDRGTVRGDPEATNDRPIRTRFIVDILSGTSAGGLNAIFLAKALANGQAFDQLKQFWVQEGDISRLINDKESVTDLDGRLSPPDRPRSVLNSHRLYVKLLDAFGKMQREQPTHPAPGQPQGEPAWPSYVDDVDLFVTATDIRGVEVPLDLDEALFERRHRHVFHFRFRQDPETEDVSTPGQPAATNATQNKQSPGVNDFVRDNDPYLTFVARCTSAFPFALEPMQETDLPRLLGLYGWPVTEERKKIWRAFGPVPGGLLSDQLLEERVYGDGGYLDNKPFGYAIDALAQRQADWPVDRKLVFIDPSPEPPRWARPHQEPPNVIESVMAPIVLGRYETIRDDLQRVLANNRLLQRVQRITERLEDDLDHELGAQVDEARIVSREEYIGRDLGKMMEAWGVGYAALHRIKVAEVTDDLTACIASAAGLDPDSEEYVAVRTLVREWRERTYKRFDGDSTTKPTENDLLFHYDFAYRLRRLGFLLRKIDELDLDSPAAREQLDRAITRLSRKTGHPGVQILTHPDLHTTFQEARQKLAQVRRKMLRTRASMHVRGAKNALHEKIAQLQLTKADLEALNAIQARPGGSTGSRPKFPLLDDDNDDRKQAVNALAEKIAEISGLASQEASRSVRAILEPRVSAAAPSGAAPAAQPAVSEVPGGTTGAPVETVEAPIESADGTATAPMETAVAPAASAAPAATPAAPAPAEPLDGPETVRAILWDYYDRYEYYDMAILTTLHGTGVSEEDQVDIVRISPDPARPRGTGTNHDANETRRRKLGGSSYYAFGAFFDEGWRRSDIMWGRLDGAERLITMLLPNDEDADIRKTLIDEVRETIVKEEMLTADDDAVRALFAPLVVGPNPQQATRTEATVRAILEERIKSGTKPTPVERVRALLDPKSLATYLHGETYEVYPSEPDATLMARALARGTQVIGRMIEDLAPTDSTRKQAATVARLGQVAWGLVEVAVPHTFANLMFTHWRNLLLLFGVLLIAAGFVMGSVRVASSGAILVVAMGALTWIIFEINHRLTREPGASVVPRRKLPVVRAAVSAVVVAIWILALLGINLLFDLLGGGTLQRMLAEEWPRWLVQVTGIWALIPVAVLVLVKLFGRRAAQPTTPPPANLPFRLPSPDLALELAGSVEGVRQVIGSSVGTPLRADLLRNVVLDFILIVWYGTLFVAFGLLVFWSGGSGLLAQLTSSNTAAGVHALVGLVIIIGGVAAAVYDVRENIGMLGLLYRPLPDPLPATTGGQPGEDAARLAALNDVDSRARSVRHDSIIKWRLSFLVALVLGLALIDARELLLLVFALCYLAVGAWGLFALARLLGQGDGRLLRSAFYALALVSILLGGLMATRPDLVTIWLGMR